MKREVKTVCFIAMAVLSIAKAQGAEATDTLINGIRYRFVENYGTASVVYDEGYQYKSSISILGSFVYRQKSYTVNKIAQSAFKECRGLESIRLSDKLTTIGDSAFYGCTKLTEVELPKGIGSVSRNAFAGCSGVTTLRLDCPYIQEWFSSIRSQITTVVLGENVKTLADAAFYEFRNVPSITLPKALTRIGNNAFKGWDLLKSVYLPENLSDIGPLAFANCANLSTIKVDANNSYLDSRDNCNAVINKATNKLVLGCATTVIPNTVTEIGENAFKSSNVRSINIPASVTKIGREAFNYCPELAQITVDPDNMEFDSRDNCNAIFETSKNQLLFGCYKTVIPFPIESIAPRAFAGVSKEVRLQLPNYATLTQIDKQAFHDFLGLTAISLPQNIETIDEFAFQGCKSLKYTIEDDGSLKGFYIPKHIKTINRQAFRDCNGLQEITIPGSIGTMGTEIWLNCTGLKKVTIEPGKVKELPYATFANCRNLEEVSLPNDSTYSLGRQAFTGCDKIKRVYVNCQKKCPWTYDNCFGDVSKTALYAYKRNEGDGEVWFKFGTFVDMTTLNKPMDGIYYNIKEDFAEVTNDQEDETGIKKEIKYSGNIVIPDSVTIDSTRYAVKSIEERAFKGNTAITSVTVGKNITCIGTSAFEGCTGLRSVTMGNSKLLLTIEPAAFKGCTYLNSITLSDSTKTIGNEAFMECSNITTVELPKKLEEMGESVFENCTNLKEIAIPDSIKTVSSRAFYHCDALTKAVLNKNITNIKPFAFSYCQKLADITLPEKLDTIGLSAFIDCRALTDVVIPDSTRSIGKGAFRYCQGLKNILLPKKLTRVESQAFANCGNLRSIALPEAVTTVDEQAFFGCGQITSLTIEAGLKTIGENAFNSCPLVNIYCKPLTPPDAYENTFSSSAYGKATLFLPDNTSAKYNEHLVWKKFVNRGSLSKYEIKYVYDDGKLFKKDSVNGGGIITPADIPVKGTHRFSGWTGEPELMPAKDTTIVGKFLYGITFVVKKDNKTVIGKDSVIQDKNIPDSLFYGEPVTAPKSWVEGSTIQWQGVPETMPAKDTTIVGRFVTSTYEVIYIVDGEEYKRDTLEYKTAIVPPTLTKENYVFEWEDYPAMVTNSNVTVKGHFIPQLFVDGINIRINKEEGYAEVVRYPNTKTAMTSVVIPDTVKLEGKQYPVTAIGDKAFNEFKKLTTIKLPNSLQSIGEQAFRGCQSLTGVTLPPCVREINSGAFMYCGSLQEINLDSVSIIGKEAFSNCTSLTSLHLNNASKIGSAAFANSKNIVRIYTEREEPGFLADDAFDATVYDDAIVYAPENKIYEYEQAPGWRQFRKFDYIATYYVTYMLNGTEYKTVAYNTGEVIVKEPNPRDGNRIFSGWSKTPEVMAHEDIIVTGNFRYTLTYKFEGDTIASTRWVFCGTPIETPTVEGKEKYYTYWENATDTMPAKDLTVEGYYIPYGDVNNDKSVDVADIVAMVNNILGEEQENFMTEVGDVNADDIIDIADIVATVNIILNEQPANVPKMKQYLKEHGFRFYNSNNRNDD